MALGSPELHIFIDMGRKAKDTALQRLANDLRDVDWSDHEHRFDEANELLAVDELRNVSLMKDGKTFAVRLYCCGGKHVIGRSQDLVAACRFADMARMRFWVFRTRDCREPVRSDLNFEVESAKADLKNELQALQLLDEIQKHFIDTGALKVEDSGNIISAKTVVKLESRRTVRDEFLLHFTEVMERLDTLNRRMDSFDTKLTDALALFKRDRIPTPHIDIVDVEVVASENTKQDAATKKELTPIGVLDIFDPQPQPKY